MGTPPTSRADLMRLACRLMIAIVEAGLAHSATVDIGFVKLAVQAPTHAAARAIEDFIAAELAQELLLPLSWTVRYVSMFDWWEHTAFIYGLRVEIYAIREEPEPTEVEQ